MATELPAEISAEKRCACTGVRWCARCLDPGLRRRYKLDDPWPTPEYLTPEALAEARSGRAAGIFEFNVATQSAPGCPEFEGVRIYPELLDAMQERALIAAIEREPLVPSQSGKWKQHHGPKVNFNKQRLKLGDYDGIPAYARSIESEFRARVRREREASEPASRDHTLERALAAYRTTDVFVLRYRPEESSNLDFHIDDTFAYGEMILALSLQSDATLTFLRQDAERGCVRVPLARRSLTVLWGAARYDWQHGILATDVAGQRTSVTLRTLSSGLRHSPVGRAVLERATR